MSTSLQNPRKEGFLKKGYSGWPARRLQDRRAHPAGEGRRHRDEIRALQDIEGGPGSIKLIGIYKTREEAVKASKTEHPPSGPTKEGYEAVAEDVRSAKRPRSSTREPKGKDYNTIALAKVFARDIADRKPITTAYMQHKAAEAFGGKLSEGKFDRKDMFDALELAVNMAIKADPSLHIQLGQAGWQMQVQKLEKILSQLPTQTVRSEEQERFQQFSTPPHYALALAYAANLQDGDTVLEPSAGTGSLVAAATRPGVEIVANELSERRAALLRALIGKDGKVFTENAEQLDNILPDEVNPTVVLMNPPFSQTAGRMGDKRDINVGANHIKQALARLSPGGRLVAIVGRGMSMDAPRFTKWWQDISGKYTVRANIAVDGSVYGKYGTSFGTRLLVIDKVQAPAGHAPVLSEVTTVPDLMSALERIRNERPQLAPKREPARESSVPVADAGEASRPDGVPLPAGTGSVGAGERGERGVAGEPPARRCRNR